MRVLICGDRNWKDQAAIHELVDILPEKTIVFHGAARGADSLAGAFARKKLGEDQVIPFPANWDRWGKVAGRIRNQQMLEEGVPEVVIYFFDDLSKSKGTKHMVELSQECGVPVFNGRDIQGIQRFFLSQASGSSMRSREALRLNS